MTRVPYEVRIAVARAIGDTASETNHMVRADKVIEVFLLTLIGDPLPPFPTGKDAAIEAIT